MPKQSRMTLSELEARVGSLSPALAAAIRTSSVLYLFGSTAIGANTSESDVDLLIVAEQPFHLKESGFDVIAVDATRFSDAQWLGSELATHIAAYGIEFRKSPTKLTNTVPGKQAALRKSRRVRAYIRALESKWSQFDPPLKTKYTLKLWAESLRFGLLRRGIAIPPTILLSYEAASQDVLASTEFELLTSSTNTSFHRDIIRRINQLARNERRAA